MLIRCAELEDGSIADVRLAAGRIVAIGALAPRPGERIVEAGGCLLLPGLHDHHLHLAALAAARASIRCGPPEVMDEAGLARALAQPGAGWLRGVGYHESVAGLLDAATLDRLAPDRPVRIQHRGGRMWFLNGHALERLLATVSPPPGLEREGGRWTGRLFDEDGWMRRALGGDFPDLGPVAADLARAGVTGLTDMSPAIDDAVAAAFARQCATGALPQRLVLAGRPSLADAALAEGIALGPAKLHLHEAALPTLDEAIAFVAAAHARGRPVAVHCVTETELIFTLAAIREAGALAGDRVEHASVAPNVAIEDMAALGLALVAQPHFIAERGDAYRRDLPADVHPLLYRLAAFRRAGVTMAAGSDAPFGGIDPWAAMAAAVARRTREGATIGADEALTPEQALDLYLRDPLALDRRRRLEVGAAADLCLLDRSWARARDALSADHVRLTMIAGRLIHDRIDEAPVERGERADPAA